MPSLTHLRIPALVAACAFGAMCLASPVPSTEQDVKAAYLLNILKLVQRKDAAAERKEVTLCLMNSGAIEGPLFAMQGSVVGGRRLKILSLQKDEDLVPCEVMFLGRSSGRQSALEKAKGLGLLTIGNDLDFISKSGMVALLVEGRKVVVEVSADAIRNSNWTFSSHLLEIARVVHPGVVR